MSADGGPGNREIARRLFAAEFDDASLSYSESDEERAPNYVVTPTGARVNRLFAVGVLTEVENVNEDSLRGRVVDPTGAFVTYAGQYQPDERAFLSRTAPPMFVALSGKARTFEPEDSDRVFTSVRPESINEVDGDARDRWVVSAAERTLHRIAVFAAALETDRRGEALRETLETGGVDASLAAGIPKAIDHYDTGPAYLEAVYTLAVEAVEQVAGERDAVGPLETDPSDQSAAELGPLPDVDVDLPDAASEVASAGSKVEEESESTADPVTEASEEELTDSTAKPTTTKSDSTESDSEAQAEPEAEGESEAAKTEGPKSEEPQPATTETEESASGAAESKSETESEEETTEELGEFDAGDSVQETVEGESEELDDFDPDETLDDDDALTEDERREVQEEFGAEFSTGGEVDEPGEAGIDVPTSEEELEEIESEVTDEEPEEAESEPEGSDFEADLEEAVIDAMAELDDGDGATHEAVVEHVVDAHSVEASLVEDAIQDAMMSGKCYEPSDGTLKAI